uniref:Phospho-N-acetylmuramoyl-pentapeptide-transferase n=1 Tax=Phenylobacterium glaciei TaxID=2803784 RepID=A0A974S8N0_9CAUL|nr:hypothetical protein JKL49_03400 [Phenylobacterium glaciei]
MVAPAHRPGPRLRRQRRAERRQAGQRGPDLRQHLRARLPDLRALRRALPADPAPDAGRHAGGLFRRPAGRLLRVPAGPDGRRHRGRRGHGDLRLRAHHHLAADLEGDPDARPLALHSLATGLIWLSINATNCSDGVDGVSGSLTGTAILLLGGLLYAVLGNEVVAGHLNVPFTREGANWAIMAFLMVGCVAGYLWYNAAPSLVLMGDAGSRPLGLLIGMLVVATNNPLFLLLVGSVILMNGATGLVKVALLRFFGLKILAGVRFPCTTTAARSWAGPTPRCWCGSCWSTWGSRPCW